MAKYDGLIIPRSYNDYINKSDPVGVQQALALTGVMDDTPTAGSSKPVKSSGLVGFTPVDVVESGNLHAVTSNAVAESLKAENVYTEGNKVFVTRVGGVYIFTLQGCTLAQIETAISSLGITTQKVQLAVMSRRDSSNNNVYPCTTIFNVNGTVQSWFCNAGIEHQLSNTDIVYGQMIIYSN